MTLLLNRIEIANRFEVHPGAVVKWICRYPDFPEPVAIERRAFFFDWEEVKAWAIRHERWDDVVDMPIHLKYLPKGKVYEAC